MQAAINSPLLELPLRRWSVQEYHQMIAAGILTPDDRVELIAGQIITMPPQEPPHAANTSSFGNELVMLFAGVAWVRVQLPITLSEDSEPEPDVAIVRLDDNRYRDRHPQPEAIFLIIEVADTTLSRDRSVKAQVYAQAGIPEYWIVDVKQSN